MRWLTLPLALLAFAGCDSSGPTQIEGGSQSIMGAVGFGEAAVHTFVVTTEGGVRIDVEEVSIDPARENAIIATLALALGQPDAEGECVLTFQATVATGSRLAFGLRPEPYCLRLFDNGVLVEDEMALYALQVAPSE